MNKLLLHSSVYQATMWMVQLFVQVQQTSVVHHSGCLYMLYVQASVTQVLRINSVIF